MKPPEDETDVLIKIPNKLLVTPYHIAPHEVGKGVAYREIFTWSSKLFDPRYPYKQSRTIKSKMENEYGEYFQLTFFLISERLKGENSFYEPFISYLPKEI